MVTIETFRTLALSFPEAIELPHFDRASFRVNKKIFATVLEKNFLAMLPLALEDQSVFCKFDKSIIYPVPGGWGMKGATYFELKKLPKSMLKDAMSLAYRSVAPKRLIEALSIKK